MMRHKGSMMTGLIRDVLMAGLTVCGLCLGGQKAPAVSVSPVKEVLRIPVERAKECRGSWLPDGVRLMFAGDERVERVVFSPDGSRLVLSGEGDATLWETSEGRKVAVLLPKPAGPTQSMGNISFSADGSRVMYADGWNKSGGTSVKVWDAATGKCLGGPEWLEDAASILRLSPDGTCLVGGTSTGNHTWSWWVRDIGEDGVEKEARLRLEGGGDALLSPDSRLAAFGFQGGRIAVWDLKAGKKLWEQPGVEGDVSVPNVCFSDDSASVFVLAEEGRTGKVYGCRDGKVLERKSLLPGVDDTLSVICFDRKKGGMRMVDIPLAKLNEEFRRWVPNVLEVGGVQPIVTSPGSVILAQEGRYALVMRRDLMRTINDGTFGWLVWDVDGNRLSAPPVSGNTLFTFLSPGGRLLRFAQRDGSGGGLMRLDTGERLTFPGAVMAFAKDDSLIACREDEAVVVWRVRDDEAAAVQAPAQATGEASK